MTDAGKFSDRFDLSDRTCLVTGGAGILGSRISTALAECGANVAIADIDGDAARTLADEISRDTGQTVIGIACDVADPDSVSAMMDKTIAEFGSLHVLHNNAATKTDDLVNFFEPFDSYSLDTWRQVMSVNVDGLFLVAQAAGRQMIKQGIGGSIIQTASIYGLVGPDQRLYEGSEYLGRPINTPAVYSASKGAVIALSRHLATLWGDHNIRVNTITPGGVSSGQNNVFEQSYNSRTPLGRMASSDDIAGAIAFLASGASSYITGHNLVVDGGWTAW